MELLVDQGDALVDLFALVARRRGEVDAHDFDLAQRGADVALDGAEEGALSRAAGADDGDGFAAADDQLVDGEDGGFTASVADFEVFDADHGRSAGVGGVGDRGVVEEGVHSLFEDLRIPTAKTPRTPRDTGNHFLFLTFLT